LGKDFLIQSIPILGRYGWFKVWRNIWSLLLFLDQACGQA
jgi:hypothetical protein